MSELETCLDTIIHIFHKYSEKEGDKHMLKKSELRELFTHELPSFTQNIKDPAMLESMMESLDADGDTEVDFQEFMIFIAKLTICCHEFFGHLEDE